MRNTRGLSVIVVLSLAASIYFVGFAMQLWSQAPAAAEVHLVVKKINNQWRVVDATDNTRTRVTAKRGEKVVWTAEGSDMYFQFIDQKLFGDYTRTLKAGQKLMLVVGNQAHSGENAYAVFCTATNEYARGDSPPKIIVE